MITVALYNLKGGVGKTTAAVNLAYLAAQSSNTVLWDWDPQAAASWYCGVDKGKNPAIRMLDKGVPVGSLELATPYPRLTVVPADLSLRNLDGMLAERGKIRKLIRKLVEPMGETAAYVVFDCPPTLSASMEHLLGGVDLVLVPIIPSPLSVRAAEQVVEFFSQKKHSPTRILGFFSQVDLRRNLHREQIEAASNMPITMLNTVIPVDATVEKMGIQRAPLFCCDQSGRAAKAFKDLWREVLSVVGS